MKIKFSLNYFTNAQEQLNIIITGDNPQKINMSADGQGLCSATLYTEQKILTYFYAIYENGKEKRREYPFPQRKIKLDQFPPTCTLNLQDSWRDIAPLSYLYTSAFKKDFTKEYQLPVYNKTLIIKAMAAQLKEGDTIKVVGADKELGAWNTSNAMPLIQTGINEWSIALDADKLSFPLEFKFITLHDNTILWQNGENNKLNLNFGDKEIIVKSNFYPIFDIKREKAAGIVLPVFSLRSNDSFGVGDFGDLKKLVDWAAESGQKVIQILPINDTTITGTWRDSYPYNSISIYAFHPMYMDLSALGPLKNKNKEYWFWQEQETLNSYQQVDYEQVNLLKNAYIKTAFDDYHKKVFSTKEYQAFFEKNKTWLRPYAAFRYLTNKFGTPEFTKWPQYNIYNEEQINTLTAPDSKIYKEISFYYYVQYNLHLQLLDASNYARSKGIIIKGDIPIGISRSSVEAWTEPQYFNMTNQAGAPPDDFSVNGQNWGFPTYNWSAMAQDNYDWWKRRFTKMAEYFDAYRIDHVLGFFRIWEIPLNSVHGLLGQFTPSLPMGQQEISAFGFQFKPQYLEPYITEDILQNIFGPAADNVKNKYLMTADNGLYKMQADYDTQRKVEAAFNGRTDKESLTVKEGLYSLISNVLFVRDNQMPDKYHPRISALNSAAFKALNEQEQNAYTNLYNQYFYHRHNDFWQGQAMAKLPPLLQATRMLACAEDLGMIPACVPDVMNSLQILSLEVQRMPKSPLERFADTSKYPYLSVCTISTHDMSTLRGWWQEDAKNTQVFYNDYLGRAGAAPKDAGGEICEDIIKQHLNSPSMLCLLSFQDWLSMDENLRSKDIESERINIPADPKHYWRYRMHISIEDLIDNDALNAKMRKLTQESGRF